MIVMTIAYTSSAHIPLPGFKKIAIKSEMNLFQAPAAIKPNATVASEVVA